MKVVDLHPEELFDKEEAGTLTEAEQGRLAAHVARCETCRIERTLRADFAAELGDEGEDSLFPSQFLVQIVAGAQEKPAPAPAPAPAPEPAPPEALPRRAASRRPARWTWLLAAAAVAVVGVATASETRGGRWLRRVVGVDATETERGEESATETNAPAKGKPADVPLLAPASDPPPSPPEPVPESPPAVDPVVVPPSAPPVAVRLASASAPSPAPAAPSAARAPDAEPSRGTAEPEGAAALLEEASLARRRGDYARAITLARRLQSSHPGSREAHLSQATLGRLLLDTGDPAGALSSFDGYLARRGGELDEPVMVGRAIALDRLGRDGDARRAWSSLLEAFPSSPYAEHARGRVGSAVDANR